MDNLRGYFSDHSASGQESYETDWDDGEDEVGMELPPAPIGQDERRMQVRAYNMWASLLDDRSFPSISDLHIAELPDFSPFSVLLDFSAGIENPSITFLGERLAQECGAARSIKRLSDVPGRSLLSRITDHYMQIIANQAPIGFEAEFVNQRDSTILYRGILLPFSNDDESIQHILGVINWKELVDQQTTDELLLEIDQALAAPQERRLKPRPAPVAVASPSPPLRRASLPQLPEWADGPTVSAIQGEPDDLAGFPESTELGLGWPEPAFGASVLEAALGGELELAELAEPAPEDMELADWLASARELAQVALGTEDRSRQSLYAAIARAYDFSLAAAAAPDDFAEIVADAGLTVQERAPMIPVVKLVFGAAYDKTRLTEYATALTHGHRLGLPSGALGAVLSATPGGLKGILAAERQLRRAEAGKSASLAEAPREMLARKLRRIDSMPLLDINPQGAEFTILVARRLTSGEVVMLGEVADDMPLLERAAKRLLR